MAKSPFASVKTWRSGDQHTGIGKIANVPYTFEHLESRRGAMIPRAEIYRIESIVPLEAPRPLHRNVYFVPASSFSRWFDEWGEHAEIVVDVRPATIAEAIDELQAFRKKAGD